MMFMLQRMHFRLNERIQIMKRFALSAILLLGLFASDKKATVTKRLAAYAILLLVLFACGKKDEPAPKPPPAPPTQTAPQAGPEPSTPSGESAKLTDGKHIVAKGDTLYSIAKKNGLDHRDLATWNNIKDPRRLRVGQELRLTTPGS